MNYRQALFWVTLACSGWVSAWGAEEIPTPVADTAQPKVKSTDLRNSEADKPTRRDKAEQTDKAPDEFKPTEDVSADFPIDFPTDI